MNFSKYKKFTPIFLILAFFLGFVFVRTEEIFFKIFFAVFWILFFLSILWFEKIKKSPQLFIVLFLIFLPFERIGSIEVGDFTLRISQIILFLANLFLIFDIFFSKNFEKLKNSFSGLFWLFIFFITIILSPIFSIYTENFERSMMISIFQIFTFSLIFIVPYFFKNEELQKYAHIINYLVIFLSIFAFIQFALDMIGIPFLFTGLQERYTKIVFGFPRPHATLIEPLFFANFLLFPISITFAKLLNSIFNSKNTKTLETNKIQVLNLISFLLGTFALFLSLSRGGIVAFIISQIIVLIFFLPKILKQDFKKFLKIFSIFFAIFSTIILSIFLFFTEHSARFFEQLGTFASGASLDERTISTSVAKDLFFENPIFGIGTGNFSNVFDNEKTPVRMLEDENTFQTVNNQYLEILTENGVLGFSFFAIFIIFWLSKVFKTLIFLQNKDEKNSSQNFENDKFSFLLGIFAGMIGTIFQWMSFSTLYTFWIWFWFGMMVAIVKNIKYKNQKT
ncbi:MAG: hypothetical protein Fur0024_2200 [Patescibacteria group bacterium]